MDLSIGNSPEGIKKPEIAKSAIKAQPEKESIKDKLKFVPSAVFESPNPPINLKDIEKIIPQLRPAAKNDDGLEKLVDHLLKGNNNFKTVTLAAIENAIIANKATGDASSIATLKEANKRITESFTT